MRRRRGSDVGDLVRRSLRRGDATGWFDELYRAAAGDTSAVPWQRGALHAHVAGWLREQLEAGRDPAELSPCLVVGCGLGDDAAALARAGFDVTAFDIAPTAVRWARQRHPDVDVRWLTADLLEPPASWPGTFRTVVEVRTIQSLPDDVRAAAARNLNGFLAPGGTLVAAVLTAVSSSAAARHEGPPWAVPPAHIELLVDGLEVQRRDGDPDPVAEVGYVAQRPGDA